MPFGMMQMILAYPTAGVELDILVALGLVCEPVTILTVTVNASPTFIALS